MKREAHNSGVTYEAFSMCRASAQNSKQMADIVTFYGVIMEIILVDYHMFHVPLFKCSWANRGNGVKEVDKRKTVFFFHTIPSVSPAAFE